MQISKIIKNSTLHVSSFVHYYSVTALTNDHELESHKNTLTTGSVIFTLKYSLESENKNDKNLQNHQNIFFINLQVPHPRDYWNKYL